MYEIILSQTAKKRLKKLDKQVQERIISALERIKIRPEAYISRLVGKKMYKFRVGDYRILLDIDKGKLLILVIEIGNRRNIYK